MSTTSRGETEARTLSAQRRPGLIAARQAAKAAEELPEARARLEHARERLLSAAVAFCDGSISEGQLRAVRELLREQGTRVTQLEGVVTPPFVEEKSEAPLVPEAKQDDIPTRLQAEAGEDRVEVSPAQVEAADTGPLEEKSEDLPPDLDLMLASLERKLIRLEQDFQQGRINASQYRAIRRHYLEQRQVAIRLRQAYPDSDRWRIVLEEGKTTFLMQLNEAECRSVALYDIETRKRIFTQGEMPASAEEAMGLLRTFGSSGGGAPVDRMFATRAEDGTALLLIPGRHTVALVVFSQDPPAWQVRALREVHSNFEIANRASLSRGERHSLIFPDLGRFVKAA